MSKTLTFALAEDLAPARLLLRNRIIQYSKRAQLHADFIEIPRIDDLLRVLRTRSPDVLTLDLGFDGVGEEAGLEAIGFIVGSHSNLPILVVSAHQQLEQFSERLAAYPQVLACIHKSSPQFDLQLETALRAAVAWRSADQREAIHSLHLGLEALVANQVETASRLLTRESLLSAFGPSQLEQLEMGLARLIERFPGQDNQRFRCTTTLLRVYMRQGKTWEAFQLAHKLKSEFPERPVDVQSRILQMATVFHRETLALDAALQLGYRLLASQHWQATLDVCDQIDSR